MRVQIAICTWNRSPLLAVTLDSLSHLHIPASVDWEILIVDNNSTDDTAQIVSRFAERLPVRYFFEPDQGHTHARNQAVEQADGDLLIGHPAGTIELNGIPSTVDPAALIPAVKFNFDADFM